MELESGNDILLHYGTKRHSGRYPWGSGDNPFQHSGDFLSRVEELKKQGLSEKEIAKAVGLESTTELRVFKQIAAHERRDAQRAQAKQLRDEGKSLNEIAEIMGLPGDSSVRQLLNDDIAARKDATRNTVDRLKEIVDRKDVVDVGKGVAREMGISETKFEEALTILAAEGYNVYGVGIPQATNPGKQTNVTLLTKPGIEQRDIYKDFGQIQPASDDYYSRDSGLTFQKKEYPASIDHSRVMVRYGDEGGLEKDGTIEIRRGVADLDLGNSHYAQVRIMVDNSHYLKGMALYSDDLPDGVDIVFNTNKLSGTPMIGPKDNTVLKPIKEDPANPFGAIIKANGQSYYDDPNGKYIDPVTGKHQSLSAINKLKEEGDWDAMSNTLSSQFLSKQPKALVQKQLNLTYANNRSDYDDILSITNSVVRKKELLDFADSCDAAAVNLAAAALPRQRSQVILPLTDISDKEVYAPNYPDGTKVVLIRYPHAGTFEIPELTVNNKNKQGQKVIGNNARDAVGISPKVAQQLSGADFDGDSVTVIPVNGNVKIATRKPLEALKDFEPKIEYAGTPTSRKMKKSEVQKEMGMISNLITDMTIRGATDEHIARAVKHSMVVIDAEKHGLDYKRSEKENGIEELRQLYQYRTLEDGTEKSGGASTLISRRKQDVYIPERKGGPSIDKETGEKIYRESGRTYINKKGERVKAEEKISLMEATPDAHKLSSGYPVEEIYADYANHMKALANEARKEAVAIQHEKRNPSAAEAYSNEVASLNAKLDLAITNAPRERRAQAIANSKIKAQLQDNPELYSPAYKKERKKMAQVALEDARYQVGATGKGTRIVISDKEWEAIQAHAISPTKVEQILRYADSDAVKERAMPRAKTELSPSKIASIKAMSDAGYTNAEIAEKFGVSNTTVHNYLKEVNQS